MQMLPYLWYQDARFNKDVDKRTGYRTRNILCMPILDYENEVMGVAQIINKMEGGTEFSDKDEEVSSPMFKIPFKISK